MDTSVGKSSGGAAVNTAAAPEPAQWKYGDLAGPTIQRAWAELLQQYPVLLMEPGIGPRVNKEYPIHVKDYTPVRKRNYPMSLAERAFAMEEIARWKKRGIVAPIESEYLSPLVVAAKKADPPFRLCIDFRGLNERIQGDSYPLPVMEDLFQKACTSKVFTKIDLRSGFHQVGVAKGSRHLLAFSSGEELLGFNVLPFGLKVSPAYFCRALNDTLRPCTAFAMIYMDDILIGSKDQKEHEEHLRAVLATLGKANFRIAPTKCEIGFSKIKYLGHVLSYGKIEEDPDKIAAIVKYTTPKTVKSLRRFVAMCAYHRRFVPAFAAKAGPLYEVMKRQKGTISLGTEELQAIDALKKAISTAPVLVRFDERLPTRVECDASSWGVGAVLTQRHNLWRPIAYYSQRYSKTESTLPARDLELLGVVKAVSHFRKFVYGRPLEIVTDHKGITVAQAAKCSARGQRLLMKLEDYDYRITYRKGERNIVPDALSRQHEHQEESESEAATQLVTKAPRENLLLVVETDSGIEFGLPDDDEWREAGQECKFCEPIIRLLKGDYSATLSCRMGAKRVVDRHEISLERGILRTSKGQRVVPELLRGRLLTLYHYTPFAAHLSVAKMVPLLREVFFWPDLHEDVEAFVASCLDCKMIKSVPSRGAIAVRQLSPEPWAWIALDHVGPLTPSRKGNCYLLVVLDLFSSWVEAFPVANTTAELVASTLWKEVFSRFGVPKVLLTDRGSSFKGGLMAALARELKFKQRFTSVRHPQSNGGVERVNKTLKQCLRTLSKIMDWEEALPATLFALRRAPRAPLWLSPATVLFGKNIRGPVEALLEEPPLVEPAGYTGERVKVYQMVRKELVEAQLAEKQKVAEAHPAPVQHLRIKEGELVLTFNPKSLIDDARRVKVKWEGPFMVIKQTSATTFQVLRKGKPVILHVSRLVAFDPSLTPEGSPALLEVKRQREEYQQYQKRMGLIPESEQVGSEPEARLTRAEDGTEGVRRLEMDGRRLEQRTPITFWREERKVLTAGTRATEPYEKRRKVTERKNVPVENERLPTPEAERNKPELKMVAEEPVIEESERGPDLRVEEAQVPDELAGMDEKHGSTKPLGVAIVTSETMGTMLVKILSSELAQPMKSYSTGGVFRPIFTDEDGQEHYQAGPGLAPKVIPISEVKILKDGIVLQRGRLPVEAQDLWKSSLEVDIAYFKARYGL